MRPGLRAGAIALAALMLVPVNAAADASASWGIEPETEDAMERFVSDWSDALLSGDAARVDAMPPPAAYAAWSPAFRARAVAGLVEALDEARAPEDAAIAGTEGGAFVAALLHQRIFVGDGGGEAPRASAPTEPRPRNGLDATSLGLAAAVDDELGVLDAARAAVDDAVGTVPDAIATVQDAVEAGVLPDPDASVEAARAAMLPLVEAAQHLVPVTGTYSMHVTILGEPVLLEHVPIGVLIPLDADADATTGPGGIDVVAGVTLETPPRAVADAADDGTLAAASGVMPAFVVRRVEAHGLPHFEAADAMAFEAFVAVDGGRTILRFAADGRTDPLPRELILTLDSDATLTSEAGARAAALLPQAPPVDEPEPEAALRELARALGAEGEWEEIQEIVKSQLETPNEAFDVTNATVAAAENASARHVAPVVEFAKGVARDAQELVGEAIGPSVPFRPWDPALEEAIRQISDARAAAFAVAVDANKAVGTQQNAARAAARGVLDAVPPPALSARAHAPDATGLVPEPPSGPDASDVDRAVASAVAAAEAARDAVRGVALDEPAFVVDAAEDLRVTLRTVDAWNDLVVGVGVAHSSIDGGYERGTSAFLAVSRPPDAMNVTIMAIDGVGLAIEDADGVGVSGIVVREVVDGPADVVLFGVGHAATRMESVVTADAWTHNGSAPMGALATSRLRFPTNADFREWITGGVLTADALTLLAVGAPERVESKAALGAVAYAASERTGAFARAEASFAGGALVGELFRVTVTDAATQWETYAASNGRGVAFHANTLVATADVVRTNGPMVAIPLDAFVVVADLPEVDLVHARLVDVETFAAVSSDRGAASFLSHAGDAPFLLAANRDGRSLVGLVHAAPRHHLLVIEAANGIDVRSTADAPSARGLYAQATHAGGSGLTGVVFWPTLPQHARQSLDARAPGTHVAASSPLGVATAAAWVDDALALLIGATDLPEELSLALGKTPRGHADVALAASAHDVDVLAFVDGERLGVFSGPLFVELRDAPAIGLAFGESGDTYSVRTGGRPLTRIAVSAPLLVEGARHDVREYANTSVIRADASVDADYRLDMVRFAWSASDVTALDLAFGVPTLDVVTDGTFRTALGAAYDARLSATARLEVMGITFVRIAGEHARVGDGAIDLVSWSAQWLAWEFHRTYLVRCEIWWAWPSYWRCLYREEVTRVDARLPIGLVFHRDGIAVTPGAASLLLSPGGMVPHSTAWAFAFLHEFDHRVTTTVVKEYWVRTSGYF